MTDIIASTRDETLVADDSELYRAMVYRAIEESNPAALLLALVHITGDPTLLDEFDDRIPVTPFGNHYAARDPAALPIGEYPADVIADIRSRAREVLDGRELTARLGVPDRELFARMAALATTQTVDDEFIDLLLEQSGFVTDKRDVPVTVTPPPEFNVIVIGAGMTGLIAAIKLGEAGFGHQVFEARDEVGGTWSRNVYPGAAVDTPSHYYSMSFELNPEWSKYYPPGTEYQRYLKGLVEKYSLGERIALNTRVNSARWDASTNMWVVEVTEPDGRVEHHRANALVTAMGFLNSPKIPDFPGMSEFAGKIMHTADWDADYDLTGKKAVVLGTGCTSVQVVANIIDDVAALDVVLRSPHWIVPERAVVMDVPDGERWALAHLPFFHQWLRLRAYWFAADNLYPLPRIDDEWAATHKLSASQANDMVLQAATAYMESALGGRTDLVDKLRPTIRPYSKRIIKDPVFKALQQEKSSLHRAGIAEFEAGGVRTTEGTFIEADVVILATGFDIEFTASIDIVGANGETLIQRWSRGDGPRAYKGIQVDGFPNLFVTAGPNSGANHGAGHNVTAEEQIHYVVESLQYLLENDKSAMDVTPTALAEYNARVDASLETTVWKHPGSDERGYYRNEDGRVVVPCPWRIVDYWTMLRKPDPEDLVLS